MSKKHNTKHRRSPSNYRNRGSHERMPDYRLSDGKMSSDKR